MSDYHGGKHTDEHLVALLRDALSPQEPVPQAVLDAGYAAFAWRNIDIELAALTYDSTTDDLALSGARSEQAVLRALTFAGSSVTIEIEVTADALLGQVVPPQECDIVITLKGGEGRTVEVDAVGCFTVQPIPEGAFRLQVRGDRSTATDWITL